MEPYLLAPGAKLSKLKPSYDSWLTFHLSHFSRPGLAASPATTSPASSWRTRQQQTKKNFYRSSNYQTLTCQKTKLISINMHVKKWIYHTKSSLWRWTKLLAWRWKRLNSIWSTLPAQILSWFSRARVQQEFVQRLTGNDWAHIHGTLCPGTKVTVVELHVQK